MTQNYRAAFPKDTVVVDPLAQARQKMAVAQRESGQIAPDDFLALTAALGQAWSSVGSGAAPIAGMEYRDGSLTVKVKPGSEVSAEQMSAALASQNASITQSGAGVWEIRRNR
jgi:general secretion pathway protein L